MTKTATLAEMVDDLKHEVGFSVAPSHGQSFEQTLRYMLKRMQRELYEAHDWPVLLDWEYSAIKRGATQTDPDKPFTEINVERINHLWVNYGLLYEELTYGIDPTFILLYREGIPAFYRYSKTPGVFETWPAASMDYQLLASGTRNLQPLVDDADTSTLDAQLVVLFAASEILQRNKAADAQMKLAKAQQYLNSILKQQGSQKRRPRSMAAGSDGGRRPIPGLDFIPAGYRNK